MATEASILSVRYAPSLTPDRIGKDDAIVFYRIGTGPIGAVRVPREKVTDQAIKDAINRDLTDASKLTGRTIAL